MPETDFLVSLHYRHVSQRYFGRPRHYHDDDIDQDFPDCVNDEDMSSQGPLDTEAAEDCHVDALIFHAQYELSCQTSKVHHLNDLSNPCIKNCTDNR